MQGAARKKVIFVDYAEYLCKVYYVYRRTSQHGRAWQRPPSPLDFSRKMSLFYDKEKPLSSRFASPSPVLNYRSARGCSQLALIPVKQRKALLLKGFRLEQQGFLR